MRFDFLTPEIFDLLVYLNLAVAVLLIAFRFYQDMTHVDNRETSLREMVHDEASPTSGIDNDTILCEQSSNDTQQMNQKQ
ncbi:MAG: hypothetical protein AAF846_19950 [Chloroflexota bacterium]